MESASVHLVGVLSSSITSIETSALSSEERLLPRYFCTLDEEDEPEPVESEPEFSPDCEEESEFCESLSVALLSLDEFELEELSELPDSELELLELLELFELLELLDSVELLELFDEFEPLVSVPVVLSSLFFSSELLPDCESVELSLLFFCLLVSLVVFESVLFFSLLFAFCCGVCDIWLRVDGRTVSVGFPPVISMIPPATSVTESSATTIEIMMASFFCLFFLRLSVPLSPSPF